MSIRVVMRRLSVVSLTLIALGTLGFAGCGGKSLITPSGNKLSGDDAATYCRQQASSADGEALLRTCLSILNKRDAANLCVGEIPDGLLRTCLSIQNKQAEAEGHRPVAVP